MNGSGVAVGIIVDQVDEANEGNEGEDNDDSGGGDGGNIEYENDVKMTSTTIYDIISSHLHIHLITLKYSEHTSMSSSQVRIIISHTHDRHQSL